MKTYYEKNQIGYVLLLILFVTGFLLFFKIRSDILLILLSILGIVTLLFYKLKILVTEEAIIVIFGIGLIKKKMKLSEIKKDSIQKVKIPWYTGIGIRLTSHGVLYNVAIGEGLYLKSKSGNKRFFVVSKDYDKLSSILKTAIDDRLKK